jgi:hypothetical protein
VEYQAPICKRPIRASVTTVRRQESIHTFSVNIRDISSGSPELPLERAFLLAEYLIYYDFWTDLPRLLLITVNEKPGFEGTGPHYFQWLPDTRWPQNWFLNNLKMWLRPNQRWHTIILITFGLCVAHQINVYHKNHSTISNIVYRLYWIQCHTFK